MALDIARDTIKFVIGRTYIRAHLRSTYAVFRFLGDLLLASDAQKPIVMSDAGDNLLTIAKGPLTNCFVMTIFKNEIYCVPDNARTTKQIIGVLGDSLKLSR